MNGTGSTKRQGVGRRCRGEARRQGQSLIIVAFGIVALVALVGLAVDVGLVYVERVRVRRAADAAALAAAAELPLEAAAQARALEYLEENNYPCGLSASYTGGAFSFACSNPATRVEINAGYPEQVLTGPDAGDAAYVMRINTVPYRDDAFAPNSASRIEVEVSTQVDLYFMRVVGFNTIPVMGRAVGENVNNLDVAVIFDRSGSMEFDTLCYGCWTPDSGQTYPEGNKWPLPWNGPADGPPGHCNGSGTHLTYSSNHYIIIEAEEYSAVTPPYDRDTYSQGMTYWVIQRNGGTVPRADLPDYMVLNNNQGAGSLGRDSRGAYLNHNPYRTHQGGNDGLGSSCTWGNLLDGQVCLRDDWVLSLGGPFPTPRADYDFVAPTNGTWHLWARGQAGDGAGNLMWGLNGSPMGNVTQDSSSVSFKSRNYVYNGANRNNWRWVDLGSMNLIAGNTYKLNIWAGAVDFSLDRLIITTDPRTPKSATDNDSSFNNQVLANTTHIDNNRTGTACNPCDARYGGYPGGPGGNQPPHCIIPGFPADHPKNFRYNDWIYDDEQPMRGAVEASKRFVARLDPRYDQIGLVSYESTAKIENPLECVRRLGQDCTPQIITDTVVSKLDALKAGGGTNIADAIEEGIKVLSNREGQYGRPAAAHIMILMTDGEANQYGGLDSPHNTACYAQDYWPHNTGNTSRDRAKDCVVYYARIARNNGVVIYGITLGSTADIELLAYVAELTGGFHRHAPRPEQLDPIFDELYRRIFLRLVE